MTDYIIEQIMPARPDQWVLDFFINSHEEGDKYTPPCIATLTPVSCFVLWRESRQDGPVSTHDRRIQAVSARQGGALYGYLRDGQEQQVLDGMRIEHGSHDPLQAVREFIEHPPCDDCGAEWERDDDPLNGVRLPGFRWWVNHITE